jgi:excisionase family DNA binding protein
MSDDKYRPGPACLADIQMSPRKGKKAIGRQPTPSGLSPDAESNVMTLRDVAEYLHCSYSTAFKLARQGEIPSFRLGANWRFLKPEIDEWIAKGGGRHLGERQQGPIADGAGANLSRRADSPDRSARLPAARR